MSCVDRTEARVTYTLHKYIHTYITIITIHIYDQQQREGFVCSSGFSPLSIFPVGMRVPFVLWKYVAVIVLVVSGAWTELI